MIRLLTILALLLAFPASAQFNGCAPGFCNQAASAPPAVVCIMNADNICIANLDNNVLQAAP